MLVGEKYSFQIISLVLIKKVKLPGKIFLNAISVFLFIPFL